MQLPPALLQSIEGIEGFDRRAFEQVHAEGTYPTCIRLNPARPLSEAAKAYLHINEPVPWSRYGYYLAERPSFTFDPLFHAGAYYVQEASSMFLEAVLGQLVDTQKPLRVLDLSAAPGGKSTHLHSLLSPDSLLLSNDVIRSRAMVLRDNLVKWGTANAIVTSHDPADLGKLEGFFDLIVVDAPCSGSGLIRREPEAVNEWSENNVALCSQRQQRILADVLPALAMGGTLVYSTCSYSPAENETILRWLREAFSLDSLRVNVRAYPGIAEVGTDQDGWGYRFWPHRLEGEGFFISAFRKTDGENRMAVRPRKKLPSPATKELGYLYDWILPDGMLFVKNQETIFAWPAAVAEEFHFLFEQLRWINSGVRVGDQVRDKLIPDHALALSGKLASRIARTAVDRETAIRFLQRKDPGLQGLDKGWRVVEYEGHSLGWINVLQGRINNYYPRELRILRDS